MTGEPHIRFYAGVPLRTAAGHNVGTLCVVDTKPRQLTPQEHDALMMLARQAAVLLDMQRILSELGQIAAAERQTATRLEAIYNAATEVAIIALAPDGLITSFNSGAERMLGYPAPSLIDRESVLLFSIPVSCMCGATRWKKSSAGASTGSTRSSNTRAREATITTSGRSGIATATPSSWTWW